MGLFRTKSPAQTKPIDLSADQKGVFLSSCDNLGMHAKHAYTILKESGVLDYFAKNLLPRVAMNSMNPEKALLVVLTDPVIGALSKEAIKAAKRGFEHA